MIKVPPGVVRQRLGEGLTDGTGGIGGQGSERLEKALIGDAVAQEDGGAAQHFIVGAGQGDEAVGVGTVLSAEGVEELLKRLRLAGAGAFDQFLQQLFHGSLASAAHPGTPAGRGSREGRQRGSQDREPSLLYGLGDKALPPKEPAWARVIGSRRVGGDYRRFGLGFRGLHPGLYSSRRGLVRLPSLTGGIKKNKARGRVFGSPG